LGLGNGSLAAKCLIERANCCREFCWRTKWQTGLHLKAIPGTSRKGIERGHQEYADQQPREQAAHDDQCKWTLGVCAHAGDKRRWQQAWS
jgi:hypothetical protein